MPICRSCSASLPEGSRFCNICGAEVLSSSETCNNCGHALLPGARFCNFCGETVASAPKVCSTCGHMLKPGSKFCGKCGTTVDGTEYAEKQNDQESDSNYLVCLKCGSTVRKTAAACPTCGQKNTYNSVDELKAKLNEIELERMRSAKDVLSYLFSSKEQSQGSPILDKKIACIKAFPIPDTLEALLDLVKLASTNIHLEYGKQKYDQYDGVKGTVFYKEVTYSHVWLLKLDQTYSKAKLNFSDDPLFHELRNIYVIKMKSLKRSPKL